MAAERELIVHRVEQPARGVGGGHPAPPLQHEIRGDVEFDHQRGDEDQRQRQEDVDQLVPERDAMRVVGDLDGVAESHLEIVEPDAQRDLELVDQDQEVDADAPVDVLRHRQRGQQRRLQRDRRRRLEERIGEPHHPLHEGNIARPGQRDDKQRGGDREISRRRVFERGAARRARPRRARSRPKTMVSTANSSDMILRKVGMRIDGHDAAAPRRRGDGEADRHAVAFVNPAPRARTANSPSSVTRIKKGIPRKNVASR